MFRLGESCSHIGALLFKVEMAVRLGYTQIACTDKPCAWNNDFTKKIEGERIKDIQFYKKQTVVDSKKAKFSDATEQEQDKLLKNLFKLKEQPVALSLYSKYSEHFHHKAAVPQRAKIPKSLREYYSPDENKTEDQIKQIQSIKLTKADRDFVFEATLKQSDSIVWREIRVGRITSSNAHTVLNTDQERPAPSVILVITQLSKSLAVPSLQWGN